jgi:hypothetical protein
MTTRDDLRSHAMGQQARDPLRVDLDSLDPHGESLLEAQRLAAEKHAAHDREWQRLRAVDAAAKAARTLINEQAEDEGLWFQAQSAPEAYLQQELRRLHDAVEAIWPEEEQG